ncbi:phage major capsid protein [Cognatishimia sp. MH4019]|uniref:phage major capsid protein n=1 Tax=Cognatishimia sp. MH4019 TaxID=2854030 RepID=UPI001CD2CD7B|nr:phage major capsid protein [Cognatishimia sp. MH4019]
MATLAEVKAAIEDQAKGTQTLRDEVKKLQGDAVDRDSFAKLEALVTDLDEKRQKMETEYLAELKEAKELAEEASLKAGRRGSGTDEGPNEDQIAHKSAFVDFIRGHGTADLKHAADEAEKKALGSATGSGSGVAVPTVIAQDIQTKTNDDSVMAGLVKVVRVGTSDYKEIVDKGGMGFGWVGAGDARAATGKPDVYEVEPAMGTVYAYPEAQEEQLDDVFFDIENWLVDSARTSFANARDVAVIAGDGTKKPLGLLGTAPVADADGARADKVFQFLASGNAGTIGDADKLVELVYLTKAQYRANGRFLMNSLTTSKVRTMKDGDGRFLWADGLAVGQPATLLGYAVSTAEAMPGIAANATPIAFGDFRMAYTLVERHDLRVTRDEITKPGFVKWHIRQRLGGAPTNDDAVKFLKVAA